MGCLNQTEKTVRQFSRSLLLILYYLLLWCQDGFMIQLQTNAPQYWNDIAEVIRLFFGMVEITPDGSAEICLTINLLPDRSIGSLIVNCQTSIVVNCSLPIEPVPGDAWEQKRREKYALKRCAYALLGQAFPQTHPWGSLTGIRPTKFLRELTARHGRDEAWRMFAEEFSVAPEKIALAAEINGVQAPVLASVTDRDVDVYVGIPYCVSRCHYCSFGSEVAGKGEALSSYLSVLLADIAAGAALLNEYGCRPRALYIGGGTPTVLSATQLAELLGHILDAYGRAFLETTVEAGRPDTITREKLAVLRAFGVTRISVNPQTMNDQTLRRIGRAHSAAQTEEAMALARQVGFPIVNMDLIAGLPGETLRDMEQTLSRIVDLGPENLTVHTLAIKRGSRLRDEPEQFPLPAPEEVARMLALAAQAAANLSMRPYYLYRQKYMSGNLENVGYARANTVCRYNIDMMEESCSILAHGAGAMSKRVYPGENRVERIPNPKDVLTYREKLPVLIERKRELFNS